MLETIILIAVAVLSIFLQIIIHEAGHLIFGLLTGYKFVSFRIFNIVFCRENGILKIHYSHVAGTGGQCILSPDFKESDNMPYFWYNAGGVILNLISVIVFGSISFLFTEGNIGRTIFIFMSIIGLIFAVYNGVPFRSRLVANDAYNIMAMKNNLSAKYSFWRMFKINELLLEGKTYTDCPKEWFLELPDNDCKNPLICGFSLFRLVYFMENGNYEKALAVCDKIIDEKKAVGLYKNSAICEKQFCEIIINFRNGTKNIFYTLQDKNMKERSNPLANYHTLYAHAKLVLHDNQMADNIRKKFEKKSLLHSSKGEVAHERKLFYYIDTIAKKEREIIV